MLSKLLNENIADKIMNIISEYTAISKTDIIDNLQHKDYTLIKEDYLQDNNHYTNGIDGNNEKLEKQLIKLSYEDVLNMVNSEKLDAGIIQTSDMKITTFTPKYRLYILWKINEIIFCITQDIETSAQLLVRTNKEEVKYRLDIIDGCDECDCQELKYSSDIKPVKVQTRLKYKTMVTDKVKLSLNKKFTMDIVAIETRNKEVIYYIDNLNKTNKVTIKNTINSNEDVNSLPFRIFNNIDIDDEKDKYTVYPKDGIVVGDNLRQKVNADKIQKLIKDTIVLKKMMNDMIPLQETTPKMVLKEISLKLLEGVDIFMFSLNI